LLTCTFLYTYNLALLSFWSINRYYSTEFCLLISIFFSFVQHLTTPNEYVFRNLKFYHFFKNVEFFVGQCLKVWTVACTLQYCPWIKSINRVWNIKILPFRTFWGNIIFSIPPTWHSSTYELIFKLDLFRSKLKPIVFYK
jgi:hypothetical protein